MDFHHLLLAGLPAHTASPAEADMTEMSRDVAEVPFPDITPALSGQYGPPRAHREPAVVRSCSAYPCVTSARFSKATAIRYIRSFYTARAMSGRSARRCRSEPVEGTQTVCEFSVGSSARE